MENLQTELSILLIWQRIKNELQKKYKEISRAFEAIDVNESGAIEIDDLEKELTNYHQIDDQEYEYFINYTQSTIKQIFLLLQAGKQTVEIQLEDFGDMWLQVERIIIDVQSRIDLWKQVKSGQPEDYSNNIYISQNLEQLQEKLEKKTASATKEKEDQQTQEYQDPFQQLRSSNKQDTHIEFLTPKSYDISKPSLIDPAIKKFSPLKVEVSGSLDEILYKKIQQSKYLNTKKKYNSGQTLRDSLNSYMSRVGLGFNNNMITSKFNQSSIYINQIQSRSISPKQPQATNIFQNNGLSGILTNPDFKLSSFRTRKGDRQYKYKQIINQKIRSRQKLIKAKSLSRSQDTLVLLDQSLKLQLMQLNHNQSQNKVVQISFNRKLF